MGERQKGREEWRQAQIDGIADRTLVRAKRSPADQIAVLDQRLGAGVGASRERARLLRAIKKQGGVAEDKAKA